MQYKVLVVMSTAGILLMNLPQVAFAQDALKSQKQLRQNVNKSETALIEKLDEFEDKLLQGAESSLGAEVERDVAIFGRQSSNLEELQPNDTSEKSLLPSERLDDSNQAIEDEIAKLQAGAARFEESNR